MSALQNPKLMGQEQIPVPAIKEGLVGLRKEQAHDFHSSLAECKMDVLINGYAINNISETSDCWVYLCIFFYFGHCRFILQPYLIPLPHSWSQEGNAQKTRVPRTHPGHYPLWDCEYKEATSTLLWVGSACAPEGTVVSCLDEYMGWPSTEAGGGS